MFTLICLLAVAYVVLKVLNTKARFDEADAKREAEEKAMMLAEEEEAEEDEIRAAAVDVEAEVIDESEDVVFDVDAVVAEDADPADPVPVQAETAE